MTFNIRAGLTTKNSVRDAFLPKQVYASWTFNYTTWEWEPPVEKPADVVDDLVVVRAVNEGEERHLTASLDARK